MSLAGRVLIGLDPLFQAFLFLSCSFLEDGVCWLTCRLRRITFPPHFISTDLLITVASLRFLKRQKGQTEAQTLHSVVFALTSASATYFMISRVIFGSIFTRYLDFTKSHWQTWKRSCSDTSAPSRIQASRSTGRLHSSCSCSHRSSLFLLFFPHIFLKCVVSFHSHWWLR